MSGAAGAPLASWEPPFALGADPGAFLRALPGPCALRVAGRDRGRTRVVTTLLHGNEPSGLRAVHAWLARGATPATDVVFVLGAVEAARAGAGFAHRMLPGRRDLNRCFTRGPHAAADRDTALAAAILALADAADVEALVDLHNNSGHNPPYGVGPRAGARELGLTSLFAARFVENHLRVGALVEVARQPAVVVEVGRSGDPAADAVARDGLVRLLACDALPQGPGGVSVLRDPRRVTLRAGVRLAYGESPVPGADFTLRADVDRHNFEALPAGVAIGWLAPGGPWPMEARGADGSDCSRELFAARGGRVETRRGLVPIMMTTDPEAARQDCLFYAVPA